MAIPLYWWREKPNFGDILSPLIVSHFANEEVRFTTSSGKLLAIGSILGIAAKENDLVWGSGMLWPTRLPKTLRVSAVRGPKTREVLLQQGIDCPDIYGDPAWLMPNLYRPSLEKKYKIAVLPHHSDARLRRLGSDQNFKLLSVADPPFDVIDGILSSECLVTSSLHGLIIAETYGIPVVLMRDRAQTWENHFKFLDYYSSTGREDYTLWNLSIEEAIQRIPNIPKPVPINAEQLIAAFPLPIRDGNKALMRNSEKVKQPMPLGEHAHEKS